MFSNSLAKEELQRRRSALEVEVWQKPQSFEHLCSLAHRFGELCAEEDALDKPPVRPIWDLANELRLTPENARKLPLLHSRLKSLQAGEHQ